MIPTFIGLIQAIIGVILLFRRSPIGLLAFVILSGLFGGSAALLLPALGGSSIPPIQFAAGFLALRLILNARQFGPAFRQALRSLSPMILYIGYALLMAVVGPRLFAHQMFVTPMRLTYEGLNSLNPYYRTYYAVPLVPSTQNLTTSVYMLGSLLIAIGTFILMTLPGARQVLVRCAVAIGLAHAFFGLLGLAVHGTSLDVVMDLFRNGNYAQLDQQINGFVRVNGIFPEPSAYAAYGYIWFVFLAECALRGVRPGVTAPTAILLLIMLLIATSSTAYIGLSIYALFLLLRTLLVPGSITPVAFLGIAGLVLAAVVVGLGIYITQPTLSEKLGTVLVSATSGKAGSQSALQRSFWALQGLHAFTVSYGLGIGAGSFRSSSFATAVIGSTGVIGSLAMIVLILSVWRPWRPSTFIARSSDPWVVGVAAGWALLALFLTSSVAGPSPDPGPDFAILAGTALALRRRGAALIPEADLSGMVANTADEHKPVLALPA